MKIIAMLLAVSSLIHLVALHSVHACENFLHSLERLVIESCDSPDTGNEDHYE